MAAKSKKPAPITDAALQAYAEHVYPIVAVGASAGGLAPFLEILRVVGESPGMAFVYSLHQEKHRDSLAEVVQRATKMKVVRAASGMAIERNRVYLAPAGSQTTVSQGRFDVQEQRRGGVKLPIDILFRSLADDQGSRVIAVVLSGAASDGTLGSKLVKVAGGITLAQDESAQFASMPKSAAAGGAIDLTLSPADIGRELMRIAAHSYIAAPARAGARLPEAQLKQVFQLLKSTHDVDFAHYKPTTVERRIRRRMALHKFENLGDYVTRLRDDPGELEQLYGEILIRVTGFFRDPEVFDVLRRDVIPMLLADRSAAHPVRVWVPGCSTGEEVYSLAMTLFEAATEADVSCPFQIFGTDVSDTSVERARLGIYPETISEEMSPERLSRFFTRSDGGYRVAKAIRDCCVFARQNVTKDPPFSRLDLVSCRNVMIYLGPVLQRKVLSIFHYALRPNGYLLLGSSETIGNFADYFSVLDRRHKIYQKKETHGRPAVDFTAVAPRPIERVERSRVGDDLANPANVFREADRVLLSHYAPAGVLVDENMEILQFRGRTSAFLEPAPGVASFNLLKMAREGLLAELRAAIHNARRTEMPVRREGVRVKSNGKTVFANIEVIPFVTPARERFQIVLFEEAPKVVDQKKRGGRTKKEDTGQFDRLKRELEATREYLQSIIEEQEAMNEELRSANEEIQSSNEELQSTNEELETAKEELQSSNEELTTLNEELENRNQELAELNNDLTNLLASIDIPVVMLDAALRIRRFNGGAQRALNLIPSDTGRSIGDLKTTLVLDDLEKIIARVIETLEMKEMEVRDRSGRSHLLRIRPYRTTDNRIDGAVLVLIDVEMLSASRAASSR